MAMFKKDEKKAAETEVLPPEPKTTVSEAVKEVQDTTDANLPATRSTAANAVSTEFADEFESGATGLENVTSRDLIIPRIVILQSLSPQLNRKKAEFIEGAEMGDFCDTAIGDVYKELDLIPVYYANILLEWAPRASGKGLVANHGMSEAILKECKQDAKRRWFHGDNTNPEETNLVVPTATFYCLNVTAGGRRVFVPLSSTQRRAASRWLTLITNERVTNPNTGKEFQPPIFYRSWKASKTEESNSQGDWFGWKFEPGKNILELDPSKNLLTSAKEFMEQARSGLVSGDLASYADDGTAAGVASNGGNEEGQM